MINIFRYAHLLLCSYNYANAIIQLENATNQLAEKYELINYFKKVKFQIKHPADYKMLQTIKNKRHAEIDVKLKWASN